MGLPVWHTLYGVTSLAHAFNSFHRFTLSFTPVGQLRYSPQLLYSIPLDKGRSKDALYQITLHNRSLTGECAYDTALHKIAVRDQFYLSVA
jgi:hypothetical protein